MKSEKDFYVVAIGASAGGTEALTTFFKKVPVNQHIAFVVVPHLKAEYRSYLDEILGRVTSIPVIRVTEKTLVVPGHIYLLTEDRMMTVKGDYLKVRKRKPDEIANKAIDILLTSLAVSFEDKAIAIILSGMGNDGVKGVQAIHHYGGITFVQDPATTLYTSMPEEAIRIDHPVAILPPEQLAITLTRHLLIKQDNQH
jgi:chemotaxis response regulator CheB